MRINKVLYHKETKKRAIFRFNTDLDQLEFWDAMQGFWSKAYGDLSSWTVLVYGFLFLNYNSTWCEPHED